jgi:creatinine amidohydrolase
MGSCEEHGPHAPTGDYLLTDAVTEQVAQATGDLMTPTIPFSYSESFRHYPGTITVRVQTLQALLRDVVYGLLDQGFRHIILFNGHTGNTPVIQPLLREFRRERGVIIPAVNTLGFAQTPELMKELYGDNPVGHGGEPAGSMVSYLRPELLDLRRAEEWGSGSFLGHPTASLGGITFQGRPVMMAINMGDITPPSGSLSDPLLASKERGERLITNAVAGLTAFVQWLKTVETTVTP